MGKFKFGGFETEIDVADYEFTSKYEQSAQELAERQRELEKRRPGIPASEFVLEYCRDIFSYFNALFGEGTDSKMFGKSVNVRTCNHALEAIADAYSGDVSALADESRAMVAHIMGNRATKRKAAKK